MGANGDLATLAAREMAALVRHRQASPVEIVEDVLVRIAVLDPRLNAFAALDAEGALAAARAAEAAVMSGAPLGPLHGVPVTIKDVQAVAGLPTRRGSRLTDATVAAEDAPAVARLRAAGAVILGKTTTTEQGWTAVSTSPLTGSTDNPWKPGYTAGGSSSGAAALAAAGCGPLHLGTDGAGSVRLPAHFCGVVGFKPTYGMVPYVPVPNNGALSHIGPIARDPADVELMLEVMTGPHPADHTTLPGGFRAAEAPADLSGLRVAFSPDLGHARVDPDVAEVVARAARLLAGLGAHVEQVEPPWGTMGPDLIRALWPAPLFPYAPADEAAETATDPGLMACLRETGAVSWPVLHAAQTRRNAYASAIGRWFAEGWDLLLTPSASVAAFPHGRQVPDHWPAHGWDWLSWAEFSYPFNLAHCPAVSVPCGLTASGLPVGLQIAGPRLSDARVMSAARAFLAASPAPVWRSRLPS
ncbi:amidase family protein [Bosea sp. (in: a-proteobacteria)]|uniref:amidase family protein n=1 Tax=Bosea sp. (in: a-proteobacteria) TaxID=1871050 RepID=UPI003B3B4418